MLDALTRDMDDGRIEIDNEAAKRGLGGGAIGRGNYQFIDWDAGGERAAALYSPVETGKPNEMDPVLARRDRSNCRLFDQMGL